MFRLNGFLGAARRWMAGLAALFCVALLPAAMAQQNAGQWAWMGGVSQTDQPGVYGTLGVAAPSNIPGSRANPQVWTDARGRLWMFGGFGIILPSLVGGESDLWLFDPSAGSHGEWTWAGGTQGPSDFGVYGTQGVFAADNVPPARLGGMTWIDGKGDLWMFGGWIYSGPYLTDLWEFDPTLGSNGEWAWMGGTAATNASGIYGTQGVASAANRPGARGWGTSWTDAEGNLWLFGGGGVDSKGNEGELNDLWVFKPSLGSYGEWTWMNGSSTTFSESCFYGGGYPFTCGPAGVYGVEGQFAATNMPGGRNGSAWWTDSDGNLWLFGGVGWDNAGYGGDLADVWEYDPKLGKFGEWAWMAGSNAVAFGPTSVPGTPLIPALGNLPESRNWSQFWKDASGNFWMYAGADDHDAGGPIQLDDLWVFNPSPTLAAMG